VVADAWLAEVESALAAGYRCFDWLGCVDEIGRTDALRVVLSLRDLDRPQQPELLMGAELPRDDPEIASIRGIFVGAAWHEREVAELFGVRFVGGEGRRLLLGPNFEGVPMLKDQVLGARTGLSWPGAKEPGEVDAAPGRRRMVPPGVPDPEVWGDRDPAAGAPDGGAVAESAVGGRPRRRRP
jgi:NADH-quinone oxidoreductase subunit C